jgi:L-ascorbate metabolism protein UlaG (beta-lactamase superfamily)
MAVTITWLGHASFRISGGGGVVYIDPWKLPEQPHDADVVFVSHSHYDHCSRDDVAGVSGENTTVLAPADAVEELGRSNAVLPGQSMSIGGVTVETVAAYNVDKQYHPRGRNWLGAVITIDGRRIYYAGDTDEVPEMSDLADIDLALLPVGGTYTLTAAEAARACRAIGCKAALPYHWGDIVGEASDAETFADEAPCEVTILQPGQEMQLA